MIKSLSDIGENEIYNSFTDAFAAYELHQIAVNRRYRGKGIASALLEHCLKFNQNKALKWRNTEIQCESISHFLQSNGITLKGKQFEMIKQL